MNPLALCAGYTEWMVLIPLSLPMMTYVITCLVWRDFIESPIEFNPAGGTVDNIHALSRPTLPALAGNRKAKC